MKLIAKVLVAAWPALVCAVAQAEYNAQYLETSRAWGSAVADFNGDGHDDVLISGHDSDDRIWYWTPNGYKASDQIFEWVDRHDCDAADINLDGRPDLYCSVGAEKGTGTGPKEVWLQDANGWFNKTTNHGAEDPYGRGRLVLFFDMNHDGYPDIYLSNESTLRPDGEPNINRVFINQHDATFTEANTLATGDIGYQCLAKGDLNHDGWDDLVVCSLTGKAHVYLNNQAGDFTAMIDLPALADNWRDAKIADMNRDGVDDLVLLTNGNAVQVWLNDGTGRFSDAPVYQNKLTYVAKSITVGDFDLNGVQDIYAVLQKSDCHTTGIDGGPDTLFSGQPNGTWLKSKVNQAYAGCGHLAQTVDGNKVLLMNGGVSWRGPNYVLSWKP